MKRPREDIACPDGIDLSYWNALPIDIQEELSSNSVLIASVNTPLPRSHQHVANDATTSERLRSCVDRLPVCGYTGRKGGLPGFLSAVVGNSLPTEYISLNSRHLDPAGESFILYRKGFFRSGADHQGELFKTHWDLRPATRARVVMAGRECIEARLKQAYGSGGYKYAGVMSSARPVKDFPVLERMTAAVRPIFEEIGPAVEELKSLVNWYDASMHISPHADDESELVPNSVIVSVSWGHPRRFRLLPKDGHESRVSHEILLNDGDLLVMAGATQTTHKHTISPMRETERAAADSSSFLGRRINVTWRNHKKRLRE